MNIYFLFLIVFIIILLILTGFLLYQTFKFYASGSDISALARIGAAIPYSYPLVQVFAELGKPILDKYPPLFIGLYQKTLVNPVNIYLMYPWIGIIAFFAIYLLLIRSHNLFPVSKFVKFNALQSILLVLFMGFVTTVLRYLPQQLINTLYGLLIYNALFLMFVSMIAYSVNQALKGDFAEIPIISEAAKFHTDAKF